MTNTPSTASITQPQEKEEPYSEKYDRRDNGRKRSQFPYSEGLLIALVPAYAYLLTFQYEEGFASYFGIPAQLVDINLGSILIPTAAVLVFGLLYFMVANGLVMFIPATVGDHPLVKRHVITIIVSSLLLFIPAVIYNTRRWWIFAIGSTLLGIFVYLLFPLLLFRTEGGYINKLEKAQLRLDRGNDAPTLIRWSAAKLNPRLILLFIFLIYLVVMSKEAGRTSAMGQREFLTMSSNAGDMALLRSYAGRFVFARFNRTAVRLKNDF
jgi:hypothetical protein